MSSRGTSGSRGWAGAPAGLGQRGTSGQPRQGPSVWLLDLTLSPLHRRCGTPRLPSGPVRRAEGRTHRAASLRRQGAPGPVTRLAQQQARPAPRTRARSWAAEHSPVAGDRRGIGRGPHVPVPGRLLRRPTAVLRRVSDDVRIPRPRAWGPATSPACSTPTRPRASTSCSRRSRAPDGWVSASLPLSVPAGRAGVQPDLALSHSSGGGTGWVGVGWDVRPVRSPWTRSPVRLVTSPPRVGADELDGDRLYPNAIRTDLAPRVGESRPTSCGRSRRARADRAHGSCPGAYCWKVSDKEGNTRYYGGTPDDAGTSTTTLRHRRYCRDSASRWRQRPVLWGPTLGRGHQRQRHALLLRQADGVSSARSPSPAPTRPESRSTSAPSSTPASTSPTATTPTSPRTPSPSSVTATSATPRAAGHRRGAGGGRPLVVKDPPRRVKVEYLCPEHDALGAELVKAGT